MLRILAFVPALACSGASSETMTAPIDDDSSSSDTGSVAPGLPTVSVTVQVLDDDGRPLEHIVVLSHDIGGAFHTRVDTDPSGTAQILAPEEGSVTVLRDSREIVTVFGVQPGDAFQIGADAPLDTFGPLLFAGPSELGEEHRLSVSCFASSFLYRPADTAEFTLPADCVLPSGGFDAMALAYEEVPGVFNGLRPIAWSALTNLPDQPAAHIFGPWQTDFVRSTLTAQLPELPANPGIFGVSLSHGSLRDSGVLMTNTFQSLNVVADPRMEAAFELAFPTGLSQVGGRAWVGVTRHAGESVANRMVHSMTVVLDQANVADPWVVPASALERRLWVEWDDQATALNLVVEDDAGTGAGFAGRMSGPGSASWRFTAPPGRTQVTVPQLPSNLDAWVPTKEPVYGAIGWLQVPGVSWEEIRVDFAGLDITSLTSIGVDQPGAVIEIDFELDPEPTGP